MQPFWEETFPYEIHITVKDAPSYEQFREDCSKIGVKPIVLDLHTKSDGIINDVMTSFTCKASGAALVEVVETQVGHLQDMGYNVVRYKIETVPWHTHAHYHRNSTNYFEAHVPYPLQEGELEDMRALVKNVKGVHMSRNAFKASSDGLTTYMFTIRDNETTHRGFESQLYDLQNTLMQFAIKTDNAKAQGILQKRHDIEWAIFDSNVSHDNNWIK
jgi:hypothetical protein